MPGEAFCVVAVPVVDICFCDLSYAADSFELRIALCSPAKESKHCGVFAGQVPCCHARGSACSDCREDFAVDDGFDAVGFCVGEDYQAADGWDMLWVALFELAEEFYAEGLSGGEPAGFVE